MNVSNVLAQSDATRSEARQLEFFESHIRPALIKHCVECHSADTEASGGLLLDSQAGWQAGGDSGPAIVAGNPESSRLLTALRYEDPDLQMPPDGKLPQTVIAAFTEWIASGAVDPRTAGGELKRQTGLPVSDAQQHWAYRPISRPKPPGVAQVASLHSLNAIDAFIDARLRDANLDSADIAEPAVLVRRIYFDLIGLPPPAELLTQLEDLDRDPAELQRVLDELVDGLLDSPQYGEHFARKWMDVVRYAESITLRGFVLPQAWRYRDYLVDAFAHDRPFDQMLREQIAGDLLSHDDLLERRKQLVATGFLALGNTNLEQQDKAQLEMDFIDEQLEVIGRAFLGQTIGCARCHDHKFDPIPTRDYYAMAGILRSAVALEHDNVSKWIERPLPLLAEEQPQFDGLVEQLKSILERLATLKRKTNARLAEDRRAIPVAELPGIVVDSTDAKLVGNWVESAFVGRVIGTGYLHDENRDQGQKTATLEPPNLPPGEYIVRLAYTASSNRASNALVRVFSADGEATLRIDQRQQPTEEGLWLPLGKFRFEKDGQSFVLVSNEQADGHVIIDAVQFLPINSDTQDSIRPHPQLATTLEKSEAAELAKLSEELKQVEAQRKEIESQLALRPHYLTIVEELPPQNIHVHIRGDVHLLGEKVPRGFLTAIETSSPGKIPEGSSGRLELAKWLSSDRNPLTARVYANRVWSWLMGQGLVSSINNFGTTGTAPTHPELLDWLASELIRSGWSTKHLVRLIVHSQAYQRAIIPASPEHQQLDPANTLYWRGTQRRLNAEALRDAMLSISGELDQTLGGSLIRPGTKADYDYQHESTRRSLYHPVFRNSLPELFEAFDFADASVSVGQRARSTVATQALTLLNHPWIAARATATATQLHDSFAENASQQESIQALYRACYFRNPTTDELAACTAFLNPQGSGQSSGDRLQLLVHSLFAALDFRYLD